MADHASTSSGSAEVTNMKTECSGENEHNLKDLKNLVNTYNNIHQTVEIKLGHVIYLWMENTKKVNQAVKILEEILKARQPASYSCTTRQLNRSVRSFCTIFKKFRVSRNWPEIVHFLEKPFNLPQSRPKPVVVQEQVQVMQPEQEVVVEEGTKKLKTDCPKCALRRKSTTILVKTNKKLKMQVKEFKMELEANKVYKIKHLNQKIKRLTAQLEQQKQINAQLKSAHKKPTAKKSPPKKSPPKWSPTQRSPTQRSPSKTSPCKSSPSKVLNPAVVNIEKQQKLKIRSLNQVKRRNIRAINSLKQELKEKNSIISKLKQTIKQTNEMYDYLLTEHEECRAETTGKEITLNLKEGMS